MKYEEMMIGHYNLYSDNDVSTAVFHAVRFFTFEVISWLDVLACGGLVQFRTGFGFTLVKQSRLGSYNLWPSCGGALAARGSAPQRQSRAAQEQGPP